MCKVEFNTEDSCFQLTKNGVNTPFPYIPDSKNVFSGLKADSFDVFLLCNPFLHKESDWFEVQFDGSGQRGGYLFPISLLESEEVGDKFLLSYMFASYWQLLSRIEDEPTGVLSDSFPNAYIFAIHKQTKSNYSFEKYIFSLAQYGFYDYKQIIRTDFPRIHCIENQTKIIRLEEAKIDNLRIGYVKDLMLNRLCFTSDFLTRFVLVYQIVELYISEIHHNLLDVAIEKYKQGVLKRNDFGEELKIISRESSQIGYLAKEIQDDGISLQYKNEVLSLFNDVGYSVKGQSLDVLLYALRNQVFHNYGMFEGHEDSLNQVIFSFERVILLLLSKKLIVPEESHASVIS